MAIVLFHSALRTHLKSLTVEMLVGDEAQQLLVFLQANEEFSGDPKEAKALQQIGDYVKILALQFETLYQGLELLELRNEATRLQGRVIDHYVKQEKQRLANRMRESTDTEATKLLEQAKALDQLLKTH